MCVLVILSLVYIGIYVSLLKFLGIFSRTRINCVKVQGNFGGQIEEFGSGNFHSSI